jgi:HSP20 family protein
MDLIPRRGFFRDIFDDLFEWPLISKSFDIMRSDVYEQDNQYVVEMDIPGFKKEDINIDYNNGYLSISAKNEDVVEEDKNYIRRERFYGQYQRSFYVGDIDESQIKASFNNGILKVVFPKKQLENPNKKKIEIE